MSKPNSTEKKVASILASDLPVERKISQLQILALRSFPSSPNQKHVQTAYEKLQQQAQII